MSLFKLLQRGISIISTIILARLLLPEDFGIVTMAMLVVGFLELLRYFGFEMALINQKDPTRDHYNTVWTLNLIIAVLIGVALWASTPIAIDFFEEPRLANVFPLLSAGIVISGFENVAIVNFRKNLNFRKDFQFLMARKLFSFTFTIGLAFYFQNYYAIVLGQLSTTIAMLIFGYFIIPYRPAICFRELKSVVGFSTWVFLNSLLRYANNMSANIMVAKFTDSSGLGIYNLSAELSKFSTQEVVNSINRAAYPGYSKQANDIQALKISFLKSIELITYITVPVTTALAVVSPVMVPAIFGIKWIEAAPIIQFLAFAHLFAALAGINSIYFAMNKGGTASRISFIRVAVSIPVIYMTTVYYGMIGTAIGLLVSSIVLLPVSYGPVFKYLNTTTKEVWLNVWRPIISGLIAYLITFGMYISILTKSEPQYNLLDLIIISAIYGLSYLAAHFALWTASGKPEGVESHAVVLVKKQTNKLLKQLQKSV